MKVFISWSQDLSHQVAVALRDWLPSVIQSLEPYVSSEDIDKGTRWSTDIAKELEDSSYGILCITKENIDAPWLNFEAGALSKSVDRSRVSPFLFGVKRSEVQGPILQFQSTVFEREDFRKLIHSLNNAGEEPALDEARVDDIFEVWWPQIEEKLNKIKLPESKKQKDSSSDSGNQNSSSEIMEEMLELLRRQHRMLSSPDELLPPRYIEGIMRRSGAIRADHPAYRELDQHWDEVQRIFSTFESEDSIPRSVVAEMLALLEKSITYIVRRTRGRKYINLQSSSEV